MGSGISKVMRFKFRIRLFRDVAILSLVRFLLTLLGVASKSEHPYRETLLAIDAGDLGWSLIEYQELHESAVEYLGAGRVLRVVIKHREHFFREWRRAVEEKAVTHVVFDPRSLADGAVRSWCQTLGVALWSTAHEVVPIARLTDVQVRRWRLQTAVVTARSGTCTIFMDPGRAREVCVHRSLVGPMPLALSRNTFSKVAQLPGPAQDADLTVVFTGALYEPRATFLADLENLLLQHGIRLETRSRVLGAPRTPNDQYWDDLANSGVVVSTSHMSVLRGQDDLKDTHFVYRFVEALAVGRPLVSTAVEGTEHLLEPGKHFLSGADPEAVCRQILLLLGDRALRERICSDGQSRVKELVEQNYFWREVDRTLNWVLTKTQLAERPPSTTRR